MSPLETKASSLRSRTIDSFSHTPRTIGLLWRADPRGVSLVTAIVVVSALLPIAISWVGKLIIDAVIALRGDGSTAAVSSVDHLITLIVIELGLVALIGLVEKLVTMLRQVLSARVSIEVNELIMRKAVDLDLPQLENPQYYDMLTKARTEAGGRPFSLLQAHFNILRSVLLLAGYAALLFRFEPWAAFGLLVAALPSLFGEAKFSGLAFRLSNWRSPEARRLNYIGHVLGTDDHAKEVRHYGLGQQLLKRYRESADRFYADDAVLARRRMWWTFTLSLITTIAYYGCYVAIALAAARRLITIGDMSLYILAFRQAQIALQTGMAAVGGMYEDSLYMSNLFKFLDIDKKPPTRASDPVHVRRESGIRFDDVGFQYRAQDDWALRHVSLFIRPGESLGIVGANGAGKSTFIKLMIGLYQPTEGSVLLDGRKLSDWPKDELRKRIGIIFQDFNRFQCSMKDNVGFGDLENVDNDAGVARAVEQSGAKDVVSELPKGIETQLGHWFDDGIELSGGQWQKIGLSRAMMREKADIVVFDEPTSALDAVAEHRMLERYKLLTKGRTAVLISHRFPTVRIADRIIVFNHGQIAEEGTHDTLIAAGGRYAQMFALQASGYI